MKIRTYIGTLDNLNTNDVIQSVDIQAMEINDVLQLENSICKELYINSLLDYYPYSQRQNILNTLLAKIRYNGTILISGNDLAEVSREINYGDDTPEKACETLYGKQKVNYKSCTYLEEVEAQLKQAGFIITRTTLINHVYTFLARRPQPTMGEK